MRHGFQPDGFRPGNRPAQLPGLSPAAHLPWTNQRRNPPRVRCRRVPERLALRYNHVWRELCELWPAGRWHALPDHAWQQLCDDIAQLHRGPRRRFAECRTAFGWRDAVWNGPVWGIRAMRDYVWTRLRHG